MNIFTVVFIVLLVLNCLGLTHIPWIWIFAPVWVPVASIVFITTFSIVGYSLFALFLYIVRRLGK